MNNTRHSLQLESEQAILEYKTTYKKTYIDKKISAIKILHHDKSVIGIIFAEDFITDIGNIMCERFPIDYSVVINMDTQTVHLRTLRDDFSVCVLAKSHGGGGRSNAAGFVLNDITMNLIIDKILKI